MTDKGTEMMRDEASRVMTHQSLLMTLMIDALMVADKRLDVMNERVSVMEGLLETVKVLIRPDQDTPEGFSDRVLEVIRDRAESVAEVLGDEIWDHVEHRVDMRIENSVPDAEDTVREGLRAIL
jgi:hypothetical protein